MDVEDIGARVVKTTDGGSTWINIDMDAYAIGLVDCYFTTPDSGFVFGRASFNSAARGIILFTSDGGNSWDTSYYTQNNNLWCWKVSFPTENVGYVSLEPSTGTTSYFLKTTNKGLSWEEKVFLNTLYDEEGIGFINANTGWIGGWSNTTYETTNGGDNWHLLDTVGTGGYASSINRYRFLGDTLGYAVGKRIYKYSRQIITSANVNQNIKITDFKLYQNYPNPFNPRTLIKIEMPQGANVSIAIYDILGKEIATLIEGDYLPEGVHEFDWDATNYPSGVYYYKLYNKDHEITKSMVLIK